jgi:hypothetical protein
MIADVLTDAIKDIDRLRAEYQDDEALHEEIRELQLRMLLLRHRLDQQPAPRKEKVNHLDV